MQNKLRQLIVSALMRNVYTSEQTLIVEMEGYDVHVSGKVASRRHIDEVISTVESVSPYLRVHTDLLIIQESPAATH